MKKPSFRTARVGCSTTVCLIEARELPNDVNPLTLCGRGGQYGGPVRRTKESKTTPDCEACVRAARVQIDQYQDIAKELATL